MTLIVNALRSILATIPRSFAMVLLLVLASPVLFTKAADKDRNPGEAAQKNHREQLKIRLNTDKVARRGDELFFRLKDGTVVSRKTTPEAQWEGYNDPTLNPNVRYTFEGFVEPWYVIVSGYYEGAGVEFINRDTGAVLHVRGYTDFSPDKTRFLAIAHPSESPGDTEIWRLTGTGVVREWRMKSSPSHSYRWSSPSTIEVLSSGKVGGHSVIARVKYEGQTWRCEGSSEVCKQEQVPEESETGAEVSVKDQDGSVALITAAKNGDLRAVKLLLDKGADINAQALGRRPAVMWAASRRQWDVVKLLLDRGADIKDEHEFAGTALIKASRDGHVEAVRALMETGRAIRGKYAATALSEAAGAGREEVAGLLLDAGADANAKDKYGRTPLMSAAIRGRSKLVELLLNRSADANAADLHGRTALMDGAWGGNLEVVRSLVQSGALLNAETDRGETALKIAQEAGCKAIEQFLDLRRRKE